MTTDNLLTHVISQTRANLEILIAQKQLADSDCRPLLEKLKSIEDVSHVAERTQNITISPRVNTPDPRTTNSSPPPRPPPVLFRARALWAYNEHGGDSRDLSFSPGDIIEVFKEINGDWWEGRCNGRRGLFPANYVERSYFEGSNSFGFPHQPMTAPPAPTGEKFNPHIPPPNYQSQYMPPNPGPGPYAPVPPNLPAPAPAPQAAEQQQPNKPPKKHHFPSGLGSTFAHSAVGGAGFGVGSALINNIF